VFITQINAAVSYKKQVFFKYKLLNIMISVYIFSLANNHMYVHRLHVLCPLFFSVKPIETWQWRRLVNELSRNCNTLFLFIC